MRFAVLFASGLVTAAFAGSAGAQTAQAPATTAPAGSPASAAWCGFHSKEGARVRCGFSTRSECKQTLGDKDTICFVDPYRA